MIFLSDIKCTFRLFTEWKMFARVLEISNNYNMHQRIYIIRNQCNTFQVNLKDLKKSNLHINKKNASLGKILDRLLQNNGQTVKEDLLRNLLG